MSKISNSQENLPKIPLEEASSELQEVTSKQISRSVSLTKREKKMGSPPKKNASPKGKKRKSPPETSPQISVKERTTRFEQVKNKYRNQRCLKEINRDARKEKKSKAEEEESSIADLLKKLNGNIEDMKADLKENSGKIDSMNLRMNEIENKNVETEKANKKQFEEIKEKVSRIETTVTDKVIEVIDPQTKNLRKDLKDEIAGEMIALMESELKKRFPVVNAEEMKENEKTKNPKKNSKNDKTQKNTDETRSLPEGNVVEELSLSEVEIVPEPEKEKKIKSK